MIRLLKKSLILLLAATMLISALGASGDAYYQQKLAELKSQAASDHMRFVELPDGGYSDAIAADILKNDAKILEKTPTGSIKVTVRDAETNKPINGAMVLLTASLSTYTTVNGVSTQTGNAFLVTNLGKTGSDGIGLYKQPLFYHDDDVLNKDGTMKTDYIDYWSIAVASVDTATAKVRMLKPDPNEYQSEDVKKALAALDPNGVWKYSEFVAKVAAVPGIKQADLVVDDLLDDYFAAYTDDTIVTAYQEASPKIDPFTDIVKTDRKMTYGELKSYIDKNHPIMTERIIKRYYRSTTGYTPTLKVSGSAETTESIVYKDGTKETSTDPARIYVNLFEDQVGGKGLAYSSSGFSYRAYAYHPDYTSGKTKGTMVRQYLNLADQELVILLSKDTPPISIDSQATTVYGRLMGASGKPLANARVSSEKGNLLVRSDNDGYFSMSIKDAGDYVLKITPPETANISAGSATINGGALKDTISISVGKTPAQFHVDWYEKGYDLKQVRISGSSAKSGTSPFVIVLGILLILTLLIFFLTAGKRKRRRQTASVSAAGNFPPYAQPPIAPMTTGTQGYQPPIQHMAPSAPILAAVPIGKQAFCTQCGTGLSDPDRFCPGCGSQVCANCHAAALPESHFCRKCGQPLQ